MGATRTCSRFLFGVADATCIVPARSSRARGDFMATKIRLFAAFGALVTAVILVMQTGPLTLQGPERVELRSTAAPFPLATTTIKWPVVETVDPSPFDACCD